MAKPPAARAGAARALCSCLPLPACPDPDVRGRREPEAAPPSTGGEVEGVEPDVLLRLNRVAPHLLSCSPAAPKLPPDPLLSLRPVPAPAPPPAPSSVSCAPSTDPGAPLLPTAKSSSPVAVGRTPGTDTAAAGCGEMPCCCCWCRCLCCCWCCRKGLTGEPAPPRHGCCRPSEASCGLRPMPAARPLWPA